VLIQHKRLYCSIINVISATTGDSSTYCPSGHAPCCHRFFQVTGPWHPSQP